MVLALMQVACDPRKHSSTLIWTWMPSVSSRTNLSSQPTRVLVRPIAHDIINVSPIPASMCRATNVNTQRLMRSIAVR